MFWDMSLVQDPKDNKRAHSSHDTSSSVSSRKSVEHPQQGHKRRSVGDAAMLAEGGGGHSSSRFVSSNGEMIHTVEGSGETGRLFDGIVAQGSSAGGTLPRDLLTGPVDNGPIAHQVADAHTLHGALQDFKTLLHL